MTKGYVFISAAAIHSCGILMYTPLLGMDYLLLSRP